VDCPHPECDAYYSFADDDQANSPAMENGAEHQGVHALDVILLLSVLSLLFYVFFRIFHVSLGMLRVLGHDSKYISSLYKYLTIHVMRIIKYVSRVRGHV
jgi:hypothetical protein